MHRLPTHRQEVSTKNQKLLKTACQQVHKRVCDLDILVLLMEEAAVVYLIH